MGNGRNSKVKFEINDVAISKSLWLFEKLLINN